MGIQSQELGSRAQPLYQAGVHARMRCTSHLTGILLLLSALFLALQPCHAQLKEPPFALPSTKALEQLQSAKIETSAGTLIFELFPKEAPWHVANFKYLADKGFYNKLPFHLFRENYIIQAGSPSKNPNDGPGYSLPPEFHSRKHERGVLGMARYPDILNYQRRSHGSQFHILLRRAEHMDGSFTIFGRLLQGEDVLRKLKLGDRIIRVDVFVAGKNLEAR